MAIEIGDAIWRITANTDALRRGLSEAQTAVGKSMQNMGQASRKIGMTMTAVGGAITGVLGKMAHSWAATADEIDKMSERTGISRKVLSEFRHAAELSGSSLSGFETSVRRMQRSIQDSLDPTSKAAESLQWLGVYSEELFHMEPDEQFMVIAEALGNVEHSSSQAAMAFEIFGRSGTEMLPMINQGREGIMEMRNEVYELGTGYEESASKGAEFSDGMLRLRRAFEGARNVIVETVVKAITPWMEKIKEVIVRVREWMEENESLTSTITLIIAGLGAAMVALGPIFIALPTLIGMIGGVVTIVSTLLSPVGLLTAAIGVGLVAAAVAAGKYIQENWEQIRETTLRVFNNVREYITENWERIQDVVVSAGRAVYAVMNAVWEVMKAIGHTIYTVLLGAYEAWTGRTVDATEATEEAGDWLERVEIVLGDIEKAFTSAAGHIDSFRRDSLIPLVETLSHVFGWLVHIYDALAWVAKAFGALGGYIWETFGGGSAQTMAPGVQLAPEFAHLQPDPHRTSANILGFAGGGRVDILAGEEGPELMDLPGGGSTMLGLGGPGVYNVPVGSYVHTAPETRAIMGFAGGGLVAAPTATREISDRIRDLALRIRDTVRRSSRLSEDDRADAWRAAQEAALMGRQARDLIVDDRSFSFSAPGRRSYSGDTLQRMISRRAPTAGGGMDHEVWQYARGGIVGARKGVHSPEGGVYVHIDIGNVAVREEADIDRISEEIARRISGGVIAEVLR